MNVFEYFVANYGMEIIGLILSAIVGTLGYACKRIYQEHVNDETKLHIASAAVEFVEQAWKILRGPDKLAKALEAARILLEKKGIDFDADEMTILIEAVLAEFNGAFRKPIDDGSATPSVLKPYEGDQQSESAAE